MFENHQHLAAVPAATMGTHEAEQVVEDVPEEVLDAARRAFAERDRQAVVMALGFDSLLAESSVDQPRRLRYADASGAEVSVMVHPASSGDAVELTLLSVGCSLVEVHCGGGSYAVAAPGQAVVGPAAHGLFSAVLESEGSRRLRTEWIRV